MIRRISRLIAIAIAGLLFISAPALAGKMAIDEDGGLAILEDDGTWRIEMPSGKTIGQALNDPTHALWSHPEVTNKTGDKPPDEVDKEQAGAIFREIQSEGIKKHQQTIARIASFSERILLEERGTPVTAPGDMPKGQVAINQYGNIILLMDDGTWQIESLGQRDSNLALNNRRHRVWSSPNMVETLGARTPNQLNIREARNILSESRRRSLARHEEALKKISDTSKGIATGSIPPEGMQAVGGVARGDQQRITPEEILNSLKLEFVVVSEHNARRSINTTISGENYTYRGSGWIFYTQGAGIDPPLEIQRMIEKIDTDNLAKSIVEQSLSIAERFRGVKMITFATHSEQNIRLTQNIIRASEGISDGTIERLVIQTRPGQAPLRPEDRYYSVRWCSVDWCDVGVTVNGYVCGIRVRLAELSDRAAGQPRPDDSWKKDINAMRELVKIIVGDIEPPRSATDNEPINIALQKFEPYKNQGVLWTITYQGMQEENQIAFAESKDQQVYISMKADPRRVRLFRAVQPGTKLNVHGRVDQLVLETLFDARTGTFIGYRPTIIIKDAMPQIRMSPVAETLL